MSKMLLLAVTIMVSISMTLSSAFAFNTAVLSNVEFTDMGSYWNLSFDLTNSGPDKDAIFFIRFSDIPNEWKTKTDDPYSVTGIGSTNVDLMNGGKHCWEGRDSGPSLGFKCGNGNGTGSYRIYGQSGAPSPNVLDGTTATFSWNFYANGYDPSDFSLTSDTLKVHFR